MGEEASGVSGQWLVPSPAPSPRWRRVIGAIAPFVLLAVLVGASGWFVARGVAARDETSRVRAETADLAELDADADAESVAAERFTRRIDESLTEVLEAVADVGAAQSAVTLAERDLVAAADRGIDQLNAGDIAAGKAVFTNEVSAAADRYEATLPELQDSIDAAADALASLDVTLETVP